MGFTKIGCTEDSKAEFDGIRDIEGGLSQPRMLRALMAGWGMLDDNQRQRAIRSTADAGSDDPDAAPTSDPTQC